MHGSAQGQHHTGDILADTGLYGFLHVGGAGCHGGAGAQRNNGRAGNVLEHDAHGTLAAAEPREQGEGCEDIDEAQGIVEQQRPAIALGDLRAVGGYQISEDGEERDRGIVGDDLDELHHHVGKAGQPLADAGILAAGHLDGEAEQDREHDERQHGPAAQQAHKVRGGEEVDDHLREGGVFADLLSHHICPGSQHWGEQLHQHEHEHSCDGAGDDEGANGDAHDLARPLTAFHIGNGTGDGSKDQRHHHTEHHVDEYGAQEGDVVSPLGPEPAQQSAGDHAAQQDRQKAVVFCDRFLIHKTHSFWFE